MGKYHRSLDHNGLLVSSCFQYLNSSSLLKVTSVYMIRDFLHYYSVLFVCFNVFLNICTSFPERSLCILCTETALLTQSLVEQAMRRFPLPANAVVFWGELVTLEQEKNASAGLVKGRIWKTWKAEVIMYFPSSSLLNPFPYHDSHICLPLNWSL